MLIGRAWAETTLASAALRCVGARIVTSKPDLVVLVEPKPAAVRRRVRVPVIAIVPRHQKSKLLAAGVDAAYSRPVGWKAYLRLVERVLSDWASPLPTRRAKTVRRGRSSSLPA